MKTIDLSKIQITALDGTIQEHDFSKDLAQAIFQNTQHLSEHNFSIELFKNPIVELDNGKRGYHCFLYRAIFQSICSNSD